MVLNTLTYILQGRFRDMRNLLIILLLAIFPSVAFGAIASPDNTFVQNDVYSSDFHSRINENFNELTDSVNNVDTNQIDDDTLTEADFADEINPRVRTYEGASCEFVYSGLLPVTDSDLTSDISAGTAYPLGYRVVKNSATSKTYTASKWTYVDIDINGDFQYQEQTIGGTAPAVSANSIRLARVSTDATTINDVSDLRTTSCTAGPFSAISDTSTGATLADMFQNGTPVKQNGTSGWLQGLGVSYDTHTTFTVKAGSAYINGQYRFSSQDITVPNTADNPNEGTSGVDTSVASSTRYNVFAVADQENVPNLSITYSSSASPAGVTNYRKIGEIATDGSSLFTSFDVASINQVNQDEIIGAWVRFNGTSSVLTIQDGRNISSLTDNGVGDYSVTFAKNFANTLYASACTTNDTTGVGNCAVHGQAVGSLYLDTDDFGGTTRDYSGINLIVVGDQ